MALKGALIEYSGQFLGPLPNIVVFQFNPEEMARSLTMAQRPAATPERGQRTQTERNTAAGPPTEEFSLKIALSAAEDLAIPGPFSGVTRTFGIGPQIAALEKMAYPAGGDGLIGQALDAIGSAIAGSGGGQAARNIPRESLPRLLFVWGPTRVLPVAITSMRITEQEYDNTLNPTKAEVEVGLQVSNSPASADLIGQGALLYTRTVKEAQALAQMARGIVSLPSIV